MMKKSKPVTLVAFLIVSFFSAGTVSQENHYWTNQFGARSALMSGAVVGGVRDTSAGFYNPGALGFLNSATFSVTGNAYQLELIEISNGVGTGENVDSTETNIIPALISGTVTWRNNTFGYSLLAKGKSSIKLSGRHDAKASNILDSNSDFGLDVFDGMEEYRGQFTYDSDVSEMWGGLSWANRLHDNVSMGVSAFFALRDQSFSKTMFARVTNPGSKYIASQDFFTNADYINVRGLLKFGIAAEFDALKLGATITTPSVSLFGDGTVAGGFGLFREDNASGILADDHQEDLDAEYKTPFSLALGVDYAITPKTRVAGSIEWFAKQSSYNIMTPNSKDFLVGVSGGEGPNSRDVLKIEDEADSVMNFAIAVEHAFTDKIKGYLGFRTDYSTFSSDSEGQPISINSWDIYHLTFGFARKGETSELAVGLNYSFGSGDDFDRLGMINPADRKGDDYILALGDEGKASADYKAIGLVIGYTYFFK